MDQAQVAEQNCAQYDSAEHNSGLWLGCVMGALAQQGRDKLTYVVSEPISSLGLWIELDAILAVVIGGTSLAGGRFSLTGTLIGALFIATLARTIPNIGIPSEINYLFKAVVVIAVCLLQSPKARAVVRLHRSGPAAPAPEKAGAPA